MMNDNSTLTTLKRPLINEENENHSKKEKRQKLEEDQTHVNKNLSPTLDFLKNSMNEGLCIMCSNTFKILSTNRSFQLIFGKSEDNIIGRCALDLLDSTFHDLFLKKLKGVIKENKFRISARRYDQRSLYAEIHAKRTEDSIYLLWRDLSQNKSNGLVSNPTAAAHLGMQMRTVLSTADTIADLLGTETENQNHKEYVSLLKTSLTQLSQFANDFEYYAKLEHNLIESNIENFDLHKAVEDVVYGVGLSCDVSCVIGINVPRNVRGDLSRMSKIIRNFLNSLSFTIVSFLGCFDFHILLTVELGKSAGSTRLVNFMISSGTGKEACLLENINSFEMGLELPIAKRLVQSMGGSLDLEGPDDPSTSRFKFSVQLEDVSQATDSMLIDRLNNQDQRDLIRLELTVLLIERNAEIVRFFKAFLTALHFDCRVVSSCDEAREALKDIALHKDLLVLVYAQESVLSPELERFVCGLRKSVRWYTPVIVFTTVPNSKPLAKNFIESGFTECVSAPLSLESLFSCLLPLCGRSLPLPLSSMNLSSSSEYSVSRSSFADGFFEHSSSSVPFKKILVVDDNIVNRMMLTRLLSSIGLQYEVAANGREAVTAFKKEPFSAVLMDTMMPVCDGFQATNEIRLYEKEQWTLRAQGEKGAQGPLWHVPIIAVTGMELLDTLNVRERCLTSGMDDYISKPVTKQTLKDTLFLWLLKGHAQMNQRPIPSLFEKCYSQILTSSSSCSQKKMIATTKEKKTLIGHLASSLKDRPLNEQLLNLICPENLPEPLLKFTIRPNVPFKSDKLISMMKGHTSLRELNVAGCTYLTDAGLSWIVKNLQSLRLLDISETRITNRGLEALKDLPNLEFLVIRNCPYISKKGILTLSGIRNTIKISFEK
eukprot:TRINITY_DN7602_c0_g1_i1.p1 TRINITY_DN7602_c0_g1~~TRINITY_DN7602_c0_g1_i1.p1  ORF type:complete len:883 (-),score=165.69 TRINITY_DN7602_c0_g1_i1:148-2796(-)